MNEILCSFTAQSILPLPSGNVEASFFSCFHWNVMSPSPHCLKCVSLDLVRSADRPPKLPASHFVFSCQTLTQHSPSSSSSSSIIVGQPDIHLNESLALCPGYWTADRTLLLVIVVLLVNIRRLNALTWTLGHKLHKVLFCFFRLRLRHVGTNVPRQDPHDSFLLSGPKILIEDLIQNKQTR